MLSRLLLLENNLDIYSNLEEKYEFVISISKGEKKFENIKNWLNSHVVAKKEINDCIIKKPHIEAETSSFNLFTNLLCRDFC